MYLHTCMCTCVHIYVRLRYFVYGCMPTHMCMRMYAHIICSFARSRASRHVYVCIRVHTCMYAYVYQLHTMRVHMHALCHDFLDHIARTDHSDTCFSMMETITTSLSCISRLPWSNSVSELAASRAEQPRKPLRLYEFEACPFCRYSRAYMNSMYSLFMFVCLSACMCMYVRVCA
jgi:hypothetical protein